MKFLKKIFKNEKPSEASKSELKSNITVKPKKLTKAKEKEFFKLIIDEEIDHSNNVLGLLTEFPSLTNSVVSGLQKGIDGYSSLMLAIRYYNFDVAINLVKHGADVNFIDSSEVRQNHSPVFFDFLQMTRDMVEAENYEGVENGFQLWDIMDSNGLDYEMRSIVGDGINRPKNCLEALSFASIKYGNQHLIEQNSSEIKKGSGTRTKESYYERIAIRLIGKMSKNQLFEIDANHYRSISGTKRPIYIEHGYVDSFILDLVSMILVSEHNIEIKNIKDLTHINRLDKEIKRFANIK